MGLFIERALGLFKYLLALFMMYAGVATAILPITPVDGSLGFIYSARLSLIIFGVVFFISGFMLFYGKVTKSRIWTGRGLASIYGCFLFAAILNAVALGGIANWLGNAIVALITGALWLRWKMKTTYIDPKHFREDVVKLK